MAGQMSEEQFAEFKKTFSLFDKDGDGFISAAELKQVMKNFNKKLTDEDVNEMIREADIDGDGQISYQEYVTVMARKMKHTDYKELIRDAFNMFDKDGKGFISADGIKHVMTIFGKKATDEEVDKMIREADIDGDGLINYEEYTRKKST